MDIPNIKALLFMKEISERVPGKNLRLFFEKPLLYWILKALSDSIYISEIIINTETVIVDYICFLYLFVI